MNALPRIVLFCSCLFALGVTSCKESGFTPWETVPENIQKYFTQRWRVVPDSTQIQDSDLISGGWLLDFHSDGSYSSSSSNSSSSQGRWRYNAADSSVTLQPTDGSQGTTFRIDTISSTRIVLKNPLRNFAYSFQAVSGPLFSLSGRIVFDKNIAIPKNPNLAVFWKASGPNDSYFVWGQGTIDEVTKTYTINFNNYPPDSLVSKFYGCSGKVGVGNVYLFSDAKAARQASDFNGLIPQNTVGTLRGKSLIFLFGNFDNTSCLLNVPWVNFFPNGYSIGRAQYQSPKSGGYVPDDGSPTDLVITDDPLNYITPIWWR